MWILRIFLLLLALPLSGYQLPTSINLGATNLLDGMPAPLNSLSLIEYVFFYNSHKFVSLKGKSPDYDPRVSITQFYYQSDLEGPFGGLWGFNLAPSGVLAMNLEQPNEMGLTTSGAGFADPLAGIALQWEPTLLWGHKFAQRFEFDVIIPIGKYHQNRSINPGAHVWAFDPYWAGTFFFTPEWEFSWRLHYLYCFENPKTKVTPGQAVHLNYSFSWLVNKDFPVYLGVAGYWLQQLTDSRQSGHTLKNSRERLFSIGPFVNFIFADKTELNLTAYTDTNVKNRPCFTTLLVRIVHAF